MIVNAKIFPQERRWDMDRFDLKQIYLGKMNCCRCGCGGDYADKDTPKSLTRRWNRFKKLVEKGEIPTYIEGSQLILEFEVSHDWALTVYMDPKPETTSK